MGWFRHAITMLTMLAVATNAVAAGLRPCCCSEPEQKPKRDCCLEAEPQPSQVEPASCCASNHAAGVSISAYSEPALDEPSCCCIKSLPATPQAPRQTFTAGALDVQNFLVCDALILADFPAAKDRIRRSQPGMLSPAAPPPSVLYGVWLK